MPTNFIEPFDLKTIFLEYFLGSPQLLSYFLIFIISFSSAYFGMSTKNFALILVISSVVFSFYIGQGMFFLILMILGFVLFKGLARMFT